MDSNSGVGKKGGSGEVENILRGYKRYCYNCGILENTVNGYVSDIRRLLNDVEFNGELDLSGIKKNLVRSIGTLAPSTIKRRSYSIMHFLGYMLENGMLRISDYNEFRSYVDGLHLKWNEGIIEKIGLDEILNFMDYVRENEPINVVVLIEIIVNTGLHSYEIIGIRPEDVDILNRKIKIHGVSDKEVVLYSDKFVRLLERYLPSCKEWLFRSNRGRQLSVSGLNHKLAKISNEFRGNRGINFSALKDINKEFLEYLSPDSKVICKEVKSTKWNKEASKYLSNSDISRLALLSIFNEVFGIELRGVEKEIWQNRSKSLNEKYIEERVAAVKRVLDLERWHL